MIVSLRDELLAEQADLQAERDAQARERRHARFIEHRTGDPRPLEPSHA